MSHQNTALVLSLLLHALVLSCALVFAGNVVQVQPPVRIELAIAATGGDGGPVRAAAAPAAKKTEAAPARPRRVVKTEPARKKTPVRPQQVAAVRTPAPVVQPTRPAPAPVVQPTRPTPAPAVTRPEQQPAPAELTRAEPPTAAGEPVQSVAATTTATAQAQAGPGGRSGAVRTGSPVPAGSLDGPLQAIARKQPGYPPAARRQNVEGWIRVQYVVDERGSVGPVKVLAAEPEGFFEQSVLRTVRAWRFRPGTVNGEIVQALVEQTISFRLR
jgi:protein TonB